jgi:hypothetical protein
VQYFVSTSRILSLSTSSTDIKRLHPELPDHDESNGHTAAGQGPGRASQ